MENQCRYAVATAVLMPLIGILMIGRSECRDLRPSEHGLTYQNNATAAAGENSPETKSFFGGTTPGAAARVPLPDAKNTSDAAWWRGVSGGGRRKRDHTKDALVVASMVCGATGIILLVVAALLFLYQYHVQKSNNVRSK